MKYPGREKVQIVCMDLSDTYRNIVKRRFPNAKIVTDRFHVIRLVIYRFMEFCKQVQEEIKWKRHITYPLRKNAENLSTKERATLKELFIKKPVLEAAYDFKERLNHLLCRKKQTRKQCKHHIRELKEMMHTMKYNASQQFVTLAETMSKWFSPIIRMWRFTKNNGITEGFHRKMKLIQRRAYGYRNFSNYRLRVLVECSGAKMKDLR